MHTQFSENLFRNQLIQLEKEIDTHYKDFEAKESKYIITDGIVDTETYIKSFPKVLWILKEPYDKDNDGDCRWSLAKLLGDKETFIKAGLHKNKTWLPIIYSSYAIHNGMIPWDWIGYPDKDPEVIDALKNIAIINILKIPGATTTSPTKLKVGYNNHKEILLRQISIYNPEIIIGGNTLWHFYKDLCLDKGEYNSDYEHDFWLKNGKVYIHCLHTSTTNRSDEKIQTYVDGITEIIDVWANRNNIKLRKSPS